uniref:Uncharacterized protein n=1 Tax=Micrurus corallinus TaxID=54390 RepID=A0A2D4F4R4_MICCO
MATRGRSCSQKKSEGRVPGTVGNELNPTCILLPCLQVARKCQGRQQPNGYSGGLSSLQNWETILGSITQVGVIVQWSPFPSFRTFLGCEAKPLFQAKIQLSFLFPKVLLLLF